MSLASNDYPKPITATRKYYSMPKLSRSKFGGSTQTLDIDDYDDIVLRQRQDTEGTFMKRNKSKSNSKLSLS